VSVDDAGGTATVRFFVNPGIGLLWLGGFVTAVGGVVAAWPSRSRPDAPALTEPATKQREEVRV
jgi:cytochrome c biogenesis factor